MIRVAVVGPKTQMAATIDALHEERLLHLEDYSAADPGFSLGSPLARGAQISERLLRVRGVIKGARVQAPSDFRPLTPDELAQRESELSTAETELAQLVERRNKVLEEEKRLAEDEAVLSRIRNFPLDLQHLVGYRSLAVAAGIVDPRTDRSPLRRAHPQAEFVESQEREGLFVAAFAPKEAEKALADELNRVGAQTLELPRSPGTPAAQLETIAGRQSVLASERTQLDEGIAALSARHAAALLALDEHLAIEADKATAPVRFRTTRNSFVIDGWVPREDYGRLQRALRTRLGDRVFVTEIESGAAARAPAHGAGHEEAGVAHHEEKETVPVKMGNWNPSGPYELLTDTYARPKYRELDPTLFFYFGFPLFYGMMLGDVGYAVVLLFMVWLGVFSRAFRFFGFQSERHLNKIFLHSAVLSLVFGILYGEMFGLEFIGPALNEAGEPSAAWIHYSAALGPFHFPLSRFHNVKLLLGISLGIAALHLLIGLLLGIRNATVAHGFWQAMKHRGSWIFILLGVATIGLAIVPPILGVGTILPMTAAVQYAALGSFLAGTVLLVLGEGATALLELPTILSNLLSYTRLVAIGLSSAGIALAGNEVAKLAFHAGGPVGIAMGVLLLALFHLLNLALGIIGPAVHSLRLHYVEFFTKFYEGGGIVFAPFGSERKFTRKEVKQA